MNIKINPAGSQERNRLFCPEHVEELIFEKFKRKVEGEVVFSAPRRISKRYLPRPSVAILRYSIAT
ncbi:MAG: hypothetical protein CO159_01660 [Candidatus Portnoybacteria bacterium CG_4_9_14_3_um_filter_40_10]|uniref:Uncharacterized protein n=1 Tax=Candidatus Portnoybacteria bacterium CG_4_9_14_3_um_filter_40_10 TaxID=1974804 RepID=A0A2M7YNZ3_9BACT|nr:MAG: hypothetical protein CO159_01660 [Candidatus Portnoybacteria bacterium CG_4_9_14_3_um_filter_40_10]